jgi:hypothetical protein
MDDNEWNVSDQELLHINLYRIEGIEYRDIILRNSNLNYLIPTCNEYNILYYSLLQSMDIEFINIPIFHKKRITCEYHKIIRNS